MYEVIVRVSGRVGASIMYDLSRRAILSGLTIAAISWRASATEVNNSSTTNDVCALFVEVKALALSFYVDALRGKAFADAAVRRCAEELAEDHAGRLAELAPRGRAPQPALGDWSRGVAQIVRAGAGANAAADRGDGAFLLGGHIVEAACRDVFALGAQGGPSLRLAAADSTYHAGLIQTAMSRLPPSHPAVAAAEVASAVFAQLRSGETVPDAPARALRSLYLTAGPASRGGFFPLGLAGRIRTSA